MARLKEIEEPIRKGYFEYKYDDTKPEGKKISDIKWIESDKGYISIYKDPRKEASYTLSGDTAGDTAGDYFAGHMIDNNTGEQVAVYHHMTDETLFARQMYCLGKMYNEALIAIEANFSTYPIKELTRLGYHNQYVRDKEDNFSAGIIPSFGFKTTSITRPLIISSLVDIIRDHVHLINDKFTLLECLTFITNEHGRKEAMEGKHDDLVMSAGIGYYVRNSRIFTVEKVTDNLEKKFKWSDDLKQDYYRADKETRRRMEEKYGRLN
jgi:phage terminase large subunit